MSAMDPQFAADATIRYAPFLNPFPEVNSFREYLKFAPTKDRSGLQYQYPVQAAISHGITADRTGTAFALKNARPGIELTAVLDGTDLIMRETFPYSMMLKARNGVSLQGDAAAYWDPMDKVMMTVMRGMEHYNELMLMFGPGPTTTIGQDIGVIATTAVFAGTGPNYDSATHPILQLTQASWAAGIWNNMGSGGGATSGGLIDIYNAAGTTLLAANVRVEGVVNPALCQIQVTYEGPGVGAGVAVATGQRIIPAGWANTTSLGVSSILSGTAAGGTFAGISATLNPFWRARAFNVGGALTSSNFIRYCSKLLPNGGQGKLTAWCNHATFADLVADTIGNTRWINGQNGDNKVKLQGSDRLQFLTATGTVDLVRHEYMKQGEAWVLMDDEAIRVGASDITFRGANGNEGFFLELTGNAGSEIRAISQQAPLLQVPYHNLQLTGIVNALQDSSGS